MARDVAGLLSLQKKGNFLAPQAVAVIEDNTVKLYKLPMLIHYYLISGFTGVFGMYTFGIPGFIGGVLLGTGLSLWGQRWKHLRLMKGMKETDPDKKPEAILKKGKIASIEVDEGRFGKSLKIETSQYELSIDGDDEAIQKLQDALL